MVASLSMRESRRGSGRRLRGAGIPAAVAILGLLGAVGLVIMVRRPEVLSSGSIQFALSLLSLPVFILLFLTSLKRNGDRPGFAFNLLDLFYAASVLVLFLSFVFASKVRENFLQPYMLVTAFAVYLLVRSNRQRLGSRTAIFLTGALAAAAGIEAVHGLAQWAAGREMRGFFFNVNHFAMFLTMAFPAALAAARIAKNAFFKISGYGLSALLIVAVGLSRCRTAYAALLLVVTSTLLAPRLRRRAAGAPESHLRAFTLRRSLIFGAMVLVIVAALGVSFKQMSAAGRLLIWKVGLRTALAHPVFGIGYGNFPAAYNLEQGKYFEEGRGTAVERLSAEAEFFAFNDYLQSFMETGLVGLVVLLPFWGLTLRSVWRSLDRASPAFPDSADSPEKRLEAGAAGSVLAYMVMAVFYSPPRILPLAFVFSGFLGWIADDERTDPAQTRSFSRKFMMVFAAVSLAAAVILLPAVWKRFGAERSWAEAITLERAGRTRDAVALSRVSYSTLKSYEDFIDFHAGILLKAGEPKEAAAVLEKARAYSSNPRLAEKLATARLALGRLDDALQSVREADADLPWRLTSKSLLAEISLRRGDVKEASRYARLVLETPMKIRTAEGEALKARAFDLWSNLQSVSGDPGSPLLDLVAELPAEYRGGVLGALQAMGSRCGPFYDALRAADGEERTCLAFLLANMPDRDVLSLDAAFLVENVRLARLARRTIPLALEVPDDIFLEYVLPYAAGDEPRDPWRSDFYQKFREAAVESPSLEEAVVRLNRDLFMKFRLSFVERGVHHSLLSPAQSIDKGYVSCGEASVMLVDVCRAVGIPARLVIVPRWPRATYGHAWIEVWNNGRWLHLTAYDPAQLGRSWILGVVAKVFRPDSRRAIFGVQFRRDGRHPLAGREITAVDVTESYLK